MGDSDGRHPSPPAVTRRRRPRDRARTEADLLEAAFALLRRDGVLAGLNLQEVAERSGVNRGQIYQYFGDRRSLLRSAVARRASEWVAGAERHWEMPFAVRRRAVLRHALTSPEDALAEALLAIDGDAGYRAMPEIERTRASLERDKQSGELPDDCDAVVLHAFFVAAYKGYLIFREALARDIGVPVEELDARVAAVHDRVLDAITRPTGQALAD